MRNTLTLLSSLALASVAAAQTTATSTVSTRVSYMAPSSVRLLSLVGEEYNRYTDGSEGIYGNDQGGTVQLSHSESTTHAYDAATNTFDLSSTVSASLDSADYSAVPHVYPDGAYQSTFTGYRYFAQLYNTTAEEATITFRVVVGQTISGSAASPFGRVVYNPDGSYTSGAFSDADATGGVFNRSTEDPFGPALPNMRYNYVGTAYSDSPGVSTPTFSFSGSYGYDVTYTLAAAQIHTFQFTASAYASAQFIPTPVPEPASVAALGLGIVVAARRRRQA